MSAHRHNFPRAVMGAVRAETNDAAALVRQLNSAFEQHRTRQNERLSAIEASMDADAVRRAAAAIGHDGSAVIPIDPDYTSTFASFVRGGGGEDTLRTANAQGARAAIHAAMSVGSPGDGGYLAPTEWDRRIQQNQVILSPMRRLAQVRSSSVGAYSTLWNSAAWGSGWVGETADRLTTSTASLSPITFAAGEIYAQPAATQRLLDDGQIDVESWIAEQIATEFSRQEGIAFISGNGANKPYGLLQYVTGGAAAAQHPAGTLDVVASGAAAAIVADNLVDFFYGLASPYRPNSTWLMSSLTAALIAKLKDGQGNYLWRDAFLANQPPTLLGRPVEIDENMPNPTAGSLAVAFGDFQQGYLINDRLGVRILRDPYTLKPFVLFYATKRVGAGVLNPKAIRLMRIAAN